MMKSLSRSKVHRSLTELTHQRIDNKYLLDLVDAYRIGEPSPEGDRSMALITGSFIEQGLEDVILLATISDYDDPVQRSELFGGDRPGALSGFYGKIILGHALGAYTKAFREDLDRIRHIRNVFAHAKGSINFETLEIANACDFHTTSHFSEGRNGIKFRNPRDRWVFMVFFAFVTFDLIKKDIGSDNRPQRYEDSEILP